MASGGGASLCNASPAGLGDESHPGGGPQSSPHTPGQPSDLWPPLPRYRSRTNSLRTLALTWGRGRRPSSRPSPAGSRSNRLRDARCRLTSGLRLTAGLRRRSWTTVWGQRTSALQSRSGLDIGRPDTTARLCPVCASERDHPRFL